MGMSGLCSGIPSNLIDPGLRNGEALGDGLWQDDTKLDDSL